MGSPWPLLVSIDDQLNRRTNVVVAIVMGMRADQCIPYSSINLAIDIAVAKTFQFAHDTITIEVVAGNDLTARVREDSEHVTRRADGRFSVSIPSASSEESLQPLLTTWATTSASCAELPLRWALGP